MSTEYLTIKNDKKASIEYTNNGFEKDEDDKDRVQINLHRNPNKSHQDNNNNFLGSELREQKNRALSLHQSLPVLTAKKATKKELFDTLFQTKNVVSIVRSLLKKREEKAHILLWLISMVYIILCMVANGFPAIMQPFSQKVYGMDPEEVSI